MLRCFLRRLRRFGERRGCRLNNKINILYASDDNFAKVLGVSLYSLFVNNKKNDLEIKIIDQNISLNNRDKLLDVADQFERKIEFVKFPDFNEMIGTKLDIKRYSMSTFSRAMVENYYSESEERVLYLDCDTLILEDIYELYQCEFLQIIGAVNDCRNFSYQRNLGIRRENVYINAGVLLIDLKKWRAADCQVRFCDAIKKFNGFLEFPDNDVICREFQDEISLLPLKYNMITPFLMCNYREILSLRKPHKVMSETEYNEARNKPVIVHFTTCFLMKGRPWMYGCNHPYANLWYEIYNKTLWKEEPLKVLNGNKIVIYKIISMLPRRFIIQFFGLIHAYVKPFLQRKQTELCRR